jgi:hypothetical protein
MIAIMCDDHYIIGNFLNQKTNYQLIWLHTMISDRYGK